MMHAFLMWKHPENKVIKGAKNIFCILSIFKTPQLCLISCFPVEDGIKARYFFSKHLFYRNLMPQI